MRRGFTLIELLAVIVILAIIALIAFPMITGIVEKSKKGAAKSSANVYMAAVEDYSVVSLLNENSILLKPNNTYNCTKGTIIDNENYLPLNDIIKIKGYKPTGLNDYLTIGSKGEVVSGELHIAGYLITINNKQVKTIIKGEKISIEKLELNYQEQTMEDGSSFKLSPIFTPSNATDQRVTYTSSDKSVVKVSEDGIVQALKEGNAKVIVTSMDDPSKKVECNITVLTTSKNISLSINPSDTEIQVGENVQLEGIINPGNTKTNALTWNSEDEKIAYVDKNGLVTGMSAGVTKITATLESGQKATSTITVNQSTKGYILGDAVDFKYTEKIEEYKIPKTGKYKLEVWGAEGGNGSAYNSKLLPGKGGYSTGIITLEAGTILYIRSGGQGKVINDINNGVTIEGGFNGGGNNKSTRDWSIGSGGGASDIRVKQDSYYARVIVAGGGGGSASRKDNSYGGSGGAGGGLTGKRATDHRNSNYQSGYPGTQTSGGEGYKNNANGQAYVASGIFGRGANNSGKGFVNGSGGGGWYGGGSGYCAGSAGGSGYVYTAETAQNCPTGCLLNSKYYLIEAETIAGDQTFIGPNGMEEVGHSGNGYVRITYIKN